MKNEKPVKRAYAKRKIVAVPELLSVRAELTNQTEQLKIEPKDDHNEFEEFLILNKPEPEITDVESVPSTECIKILDEGILNAPQTNNSSTISYNFPKTSVLMLTANGNYVIANLSNDVPKKPAEIKVLPQPMEQVIILNTNELQFAEMEVECQETDQFVDEKG